MGMMSDLDIAAHNAGLSVEERATTPLPVLLDLMSRHDARERLIRAAARHWALAERARRQHDDAAEALNRALACGVYAAARALGVFDFEFGLRADALALGLVRDLYTEEAM